MCVVVGLSQSLSLTLFCVKFSNDNLTSNPTSLTLPDWLKPLDWMIYIKVIWSEVQLFENNYDMKTDDWLSAMFTFWWIIIIYH